ncbi:hypothetical protein [Pseudomonas sp. RIT-PI-S]|uniref:hypothetical protein n=1 Tax=Pseudomonas sp. RIT-PI-S TaxID=3035295 RepID=UPI0021DB782A|nr:hypothetical protein [Pseudomonas sp. RIT-PI-S]
MNRTPLLALAAMVLTLLIGALLDGRAVMAAGLSAAVTCVTLALGCLFWGFLLPLVRGQWRAALGPSLAVGLASLPWALLGLLILLPAAWLLYPWSEHPTEGFRGFWLQPITFVFRALIYAGLWLWLSSWLRVGMGQVRAGIGVIELVLSLSAAGIDWLMSLDAHLASTLFGLFYVLRALLMGLAFAGLTGGPHSQRIVRGLLLGACIFWLYLQFMQYLIVWAGNLPREIHWYLERSTHGWGAVAGVLALTQAVLPLMLLALPWGKRPRVLHWACGLTLLSGFVESSWLGLPSLGLAPSLWLPLAWLAWAGAIASLTLWRRRHER